ncbi:MAG: hypothetical protein WBW92_08605 [Rhodanobacteraceae bacterium]
MIKHMASFVLVSAGQLSTSVRFRPEGITMSHGWAAAALPWHTAFLAIMVLLDIAAWAYALHVLPPGKYSTVLKAVSFCALAVPVGVICVWAAHDMGVHRIALQAAVFADPTHSPDRFAKLAAHSQWQIDLNLIRDIKVYAFFTFWVLPVFAVMQGQKEIASRPVCLAMTLAPALCGLLLVIPWA